MLFYLGYLTIDGDVAGFPKLNIPNKVMEEIYADYFIQMINNEIKIEVNNTYTQIATEVALEGKIEKITELLHKYLNNLSNRDFQNFDEKYVKILFYSIAMNLKIFSIKSEMEVQRKYPDLLLIPKDTTKNYQAVIIEFKYLKNSEASKLEEKKEEARRQIIEYSEYEDIKCIPNLNKYIIVAVNDEIYVEKII